MSIFHEIYRTTDIHDLFDIIELYMDERGFYISPYSDLEQESIYYADRAEELNTDKLLMQEISTVLKHCHARYKDITSR